MPFSDSEKFIYDKCCARITDLNRVIFNYRLLYVSIIAAYFGGLTLASNIASGTKIISFLDTYAIYVNTLNAIVIASICIMAFFDYIHQELVEHAIETLTHLDQRKARVMGVSTFARGSEALTSFRINTAIVMFYVLPVLCLTMFSLVIGAVVFNDQPLVGWAETIGDLCKQREHELANYAGVAMTQLEINREINVCVNEFVTYRFSDGVRRTLVLASGFCTIFLIYFFLYSFHRIAGKFFVLQGWGQFKSSIDQVIKLLVPVMTLLWFGLFCWVFISAPMALQVGSVLFGWLI